MHAAALHSGKSQPQRTRALAQFKNGQITVLVATAIPRPVACTSTTSISWSTSTRPPTPRTMCTARAGPPGRSVRQRAAAKLVLAGQRREMSRLMAEAGIESTITKVRSGEAELSRITGAKAPSGTPLDGGPAAPRPRTPTLLRGLGTSKDTSRGAGGKSRKAREARKLRRSPQGGPGAYLINGRVGAQAQNAVLGLKHHMDAGWQI
ncbi:RNA helicase OS=Streptomyces antimycoticus OX=68175 GN=SSPO_097550 PE=4 SV=1 [Streptomyces antimycoticus]